MSGQKRKRRASENEIELHASPSLSTKLVQILRSPDGTFALFLLPSHELVASSASPRRLSDWALHEQGAKRVEWSFNLTEYEEEERE